MTVGPGHCLELEDLSCRVVCEKSHVSDVCGFTSGEVGDRPGHGGWS